METNDQAMIDYIVQLRAEGYQDQQIIQILVEQGYSDQQILVAFERISGLAPMPEPATPQPELSQSDTQVPEFVAPQTVTPPPDTIPTEPEVAVGDPLVKVPYSSEPLIPRQSGSGIPFSQIGIGVLLVIFLGLSGYYLYQERGRFSWLSWPAPSSSPMASNDQQSSFNAVSLNTSLPLSETVELEINGAQFIPSNEVKSYGIEALGEDQQLLMVYYGIRNNSQAYQQLASDLEIKVVNDQKAQVGVLTSTSLQDVREMRELLGQQYTTSALLFSVPKSVSSLNGLYVSVVLGVGGTPFYVRLQ